MNIATLNRANELSRQIESLKDTAAVYRAADGIAATITVAPEGKSVAFERRYYMPLHEPEVKAAIVAALERRMAAALAELAALGVEVTP
jgi:hypothetical protein